MMDNPNISHTKHRFLSLPIIKEVGRAYNLEIHPDRVLSLWVFAVVTGGRAVIQIGSEQAVLNAGDFFLLPPSIRHFGLEKSSFDTVWFHFDVDAEAFEEASISNLDAHAPLVPFFGAMPTGINYLEWGLFVKQSIELGHMRLTEAGTQLWAMLYQATVVQKRSNSIATREARIAEATIEYLYRHYSTDISSDMLVDALGYSYGHMERSFRHCFGMSIRSKLIEIRIQEARSLLIHGKSIKETAMSVGFNDYYYFLRMFKKTTGVSPGSVVKAL